VVLSNDHLLDLEKDLFSELLYIPVDTDFKEEEAIRYLLALERWKPRV